MKGESVRQLRRAHLSLGIGEIAAALVFCGAMAWVIAPRIASASDQRVLWAALVPLAVILIQAGIYWLAARAWIGRGRMPDVMRRTYLAFRALDAVLLIVALVALIATSPTAGVLVLALVVWLFGVVEYLNYFVVRLAYPASRWPQEVTRWRTPRLAKDLRAGSSR